MEITLSHTEAEQFAYDRLSLDLAHYDIKVHIAIPKPSETYYLRHEDFQRIWKSAIQPTNDVPDLQPAKIGLIKLYRKLATELCQSDPGLLQAKIFVETHTK